MWAVLLTCRIFRHSREWAHRKRSGGSHTAFLQCSLVSSELSPQSLSPSQMNFLGTHTEFPHSNSNGLHSRLFGWKCADNKICIMHSFESRYVNPYSHIHFSITAEIQLWILSQRYSKLIMRLGEASPQQNISNVILQATASCMGFLHEPKAGKRKQLICKAAFQSCLYHV